MPRPTSRRSPLVRVLGGLGVLGMASPAIWLVAGAVLWVVARDALDAGLLFYAFGSTLLAMVVGVLLFAWADRLDQGRLGRSRRVSPPDPPSDTSGSGRSGAGPGR